MQKKELRSEAKQIRASIIDKPQQSQKILQQLQTIPCFLEAKRIGIYVSMKDEVDTHPILAYLFAQKKIVACPTTEKDGIMQFYQLNNLKELQKTGPFGIEEPTKETCITFSKSDVLLIPALAFDEHKNRLGYGGGYYDRYLEKNEVITIGLSFEEQLLPSLPTESHDQTLDYLVTSTRVIH